MLGADQHRVIVLLVQELFLSEDVEGSSDGWPEMSHPEVGSSVEGLIGFLDNDQINEIFKAGVSSGDHIADEDESRHAQLGHFIHESLYLGFDHPPSLVPEAEHHWSHVVTLPEI